MSNNAAPADLSAYANQFDELRTEERTPIIDINAINPLSDLRDRWKNVTNTETEYHLSTSANTNDLAELRTEERGQYTAGYQVQAGVGVRIPSTPTGDTEMRWGYFETDSNDDPLNGYYFGVDSTGIFVAKVRGGNETKIYQGEWNRDNLNGSEGTDGPNPSGLTLDLSDGQVFQVEFVYYGYGGIEMQVLMDSAESDSDSASEMVTVHVFQPSGETSIKNTNLPIQQQIASGGSSNDALDLFVGGRQFSIIGKDTTNSRRTWHYRQSLSSVDDTKWYAAISFAIKDSTDIGSIDFSHIIGEIIGFEANPDSTGYKWQIRRGVSLDNPTWENPESAEDKQDETGLKVDTSVADVQDGNGDLTGVHLDGGLLTAGEKNKINVDTEKAVGQVSNSQVVTLLFKALPTQSGTVSDILFKLAENW